MPFFPLEGLGGFNQEVSADFANVLYGTALTHCGMKAEKMKEDHHDNEMLSCPVKDGNQKLQVDSGLRSPKLEHLSFWPVWEVKGGLPHIRWFRFGVRVRPPRWFAENGSENGDVAESAFGPTTAVIRHSLRWLQASLQRGKTFGHLDDLMAPSFF